MSEEMKIVRATRTVIEGKLLAALESDSGQVAALFTKRDLEDLLAGLTDAIKYNASRPLLRISEQTLRIQSLRDDLKLLLKTAFQ